MNLLTVGYLVIIVAAFYFLLIRPQQKRAKEQQELMASIRPGDRVVTAGGLYGTIERVEDEIVELRIADGVVVDMARSSIVRRAEAVPTVHEDAEPAEHPHLDSDEVEEPPVRVSEDEGPHEATAPPPLEMKKDE